MDMNDILKSIGQKQSQEKKKSAPRIQMIHYTKLKPSPVEFNASSRALRILGSTGIMYEDEVGQTRKVLSAAALTYVAGAASALLSLLRLIILFGGRDND